MDMLKLNNFEFEVKYAEINFRQRNYQGKSYVTINITNEFFPKMIGESILYGSVEAKIDLPDIHKIDDLVSKTWEKDIGSVFLSVNNNGVWESTALKEFKVTFEKREKQYLYFRITGEDFLYEGSARMISLYTTSTEEKDLEKKFSLKDFYPKAIHQSIGDKVILRYFVK